MPSAGRPFTKRALTGLRERGIRVQRIVLHTGVSSQERGERPYPERYSVPEHTARRINATKAAGGRVIAVGTTVVRALETVAAPDGTVRADAGWTSLTVTPERGVRAVDGLLTGWHEPDASHLLMLEAIAGRPLLERSYAAARERGYRWHEFGDLHLIAALKLKIPCRRAIPEGRCASPSFPAHVAVWLGMPSWSSRWALSLLLDLAQRDAAVRAGGDQRPHQRCLPPRARRPHAPGGRADRRATTPRTRRPRSRLRTALLRVVELDPSRQAGRRPSSCATTPRT